MAVLFPHVWNYRLVFLYATIFLHYTTRCVLGNSTIAAPISVAPSTNWDGNDGPWSSFAVQVGTPPQTVRVLVSSSGSSLWVVTPAGCTKTDPSSCVDLRGRQFNINASSTWQDKGLFALPFIAEASLGYSGSADFGFDNVTLGFQGAGGPTLEHQVVAGFDTKQSYTGMLPLTSRGVNFTDFNHPEPSLLASLRSQGKIASLTWSYTAGAPWTPKKTFGNLVFGGYDTNRFVRNEQTFIFGEDISRDLLVGVQSITSGSDSLLPNSIITYIDSTVSHIWLPLESCKRFETVFGLTWNPSAELYLVNDTLHSLLLAKNASVQFTLGQTTNSGGPTVNITLPYGAFDLTVTNPPLVNGTSRYFPLKRAANDTQFTLGRTFLQAAYLTVDYDRSNFSVSQALYPDPSVPQHLVPILDPSTANTLNSSDPSSNNNTNKQTSTGLSAGAIAGIVIGALALLLIPLAIWLLIRRRRRRTRAKQQADADADAAAADLAYAEDKPSTDDPDKTIPVGYGHKAELDARDTTFLGHEVPATEAAGADRKSKVMVSPEDDGVDEVRVWKEEGGLGVGQDERAAAPVFEMSADQEVREMDGGSEAARRAELHDGRGRA